MEYKEFLESKIKRHTVSGFDVADLNNHIVFNSDYHLSDVKYSGNTIAECYNYVCVFYRKHFERLHHTSYIQQNLLTN